MSVLNKMLRDLDQRQASAGTQVELKQSISRQDSRPLWLNLLLLLSAVLLLIAIYAILTQPQPIDVKPFSVAVEEAPAMEPSATLNQPLAEQTQQPVAASEQISAALPTNTIVMAEEHASTAQSEPAQEQVVLGQRLEQDVAADEVQTIDITEHDVAVEPAVAHVPQQESKAEIAVQRTIPTPAQRADAIQQRAVLAAQSGQLTEAISLWQQVQQLLPTQPDAYIAQAGLWQQLGLRDKVQQVLQQGVTLNADSAALRLLLAQHYASAGQWAEANTVLTPQFELTTHPQYYGFKATVLQQLGDSSSAGHWFSQLILLQPEQARWWLGAAIAFEQSGQRQQAHLHYRQALQWGDSLSAESRNYIQQRLAATE